MRSGSALTPNDRHRRPHRPLDGVGSSLCARSEAGSGPNLETEAWPGCAGESLVGIRRAGSRHGRRLVVGYDVDDTLCCPVLGFGQPEAEEFSWCNPSLHWGTVSWRGQTLP
jgi:hypothetical protein